MLTSPDATRSPRPRRSWDRDALHASGVLEAPYVSLRREPGAVRARGEHHRRWGGEDDAAGFAEWSWDGRALRARTGFFGFRPLFYWEHRDGIAVSPSLVRLLALGAPAALDDEAMAVFLRVGFFVGEDTPFRAVRALPPNASLVWDDAGMRLTGGPCLPPVVPMSRDDAMEAYIATFRDAIRRSLPARDGAVLPLSGGCDSRHILLELCALGAPPDACVTLPNYPPRGALDLTVARMVARAVGVPHEIVAMDPSRVRAELRKNLETHFCADEHAWYVSLATRIAGRWGTTYDGIAGDVLSSGFRLHPDRVPFMERGAWRELATDYLSDDGVLRLMPAEVARRFPREGAVERFAAQLARHADAGNPLSSFFFWNRTRREIGLVPFGMLAGAARVVTPFLDRAVFDLLASLPWQVFRDRRFHIDTIRRAHPRFAHLPFEAEVRRVAAAPEPPSWSRHYRRMLREVARYALTRRRSALVSRSWLLPRSGYWSVRGDFGDMEVIPRALFLLQLESIPRALG